MATKLQKLEDRRQLAPIKVGMQHTPGHGVPSELLGIAGCIALSRITRMWWLTRQFVEQIKIPSDYCTSEV